MNVTLISQALTHRYGGSAVSEASLARALQDSCQVTVLCRKGGLEVDFVKSFGIRIVEEFSPFSVLMACLRKSHPLINQILKADVVHLNGHWKWENFFWARLCKKTGTPFILHPRGMLLVGHRRVWLKRLFNMVLGKAVVRAARRIILLSEFERRHLKSYQVDPAKIVVIPNAVFRGQPDLVQRAPAPEPYLLYFGRLESRKNLLFLIEAYHAYLKAGGKCRLRCIGPVERGYDKTLRSDVFRRGIQESVEISSGVYGDAKWDILSAATATVYPSVEEPYGRVPFEAVLAGSLPIVPQESGSAEYLAPLIPDCVYPVDDAAALAERFFWAERRQPRTEQARQKAYRWVRAQLSWEVITPRVLDVYSSLLNATTRASA